MTTNDRRVEDRQALERLLAIYGADRTRWPARERLRFASVIAEDTVARRQFDEAAALDRVLDQAPRASEARVEALKARIVTAALASTDKGLVRAGTASPAGGNVIPLTRRPAFKPTFSRAEWPAAALLAASLVLGVMLGSYGTFDTAVQEVAAVTGYSTSTDSSQLALADDIDTSGDEDQL
jgi:hypothetical protein